MRFWDASTAALRQVAKFSTSRCFVGDDLDTPPDDAEDELDEDEWPPFRKVERHLGWNPTRLVEHTSSTCFHHPLSTNIRSNLNDQVTESFK